MPQNKSTKVFSEITNFFTSSEKGILKVMELYKALNLYRIKTGVPQMPQSTYKHGDILLGLLLFPLFSIDNVYSYQTHYLKRIIEAGKNTFYRLKNNPLVDWRSIVAKSNKSLFKQKEKHFSSDTGSPKCLVVDDSDFGKTSYLTEHVGKIWSHVLHKVIYGFKGLFLGYWDGKSFYALDFSLHKEKGKNKKRPYGLTPKQKKRQYSKQRNKGTSGYEREQELYKDKITTAIKMIKKAVKTRIKVDYILMDSWFFAEAFLKMLSEFKSTIHIVGMLKMAKAKYLYQGNHYTAKELGSLLKKRKKVKWISSLNLYCAEAEVEFKSHQLKLYFCKTSKRGKWHVLVSTNTKLGIHKAYEIYSIRWSIEVFFKEAKQYFGLGKSQSQDFDAQIADISIAIIQYNVFSLAKRIEAYETLGGLFKEIKEQVIEYTISERIWGFIQELLRIMSEICDGNFNELIVSVMKNEKKDNKIITLIEASFSKAA